MELTAEELRLRETREGVPWRQWGPYLAERQWGTVREDYSDDGDAWSYFSHDQARSRAYRWGEDGIAGVCDDHGELCLALALWNGADPIIKERLFGLTNAEGNHGEDVKELYFYLDSTPTHSFMRYRYRYPQRAFPYDDLVRTNAERGFGDDEYELLDTGVLDDDRYFDVDVDYAKDGPQALVMRVTVRNRGPEAAHIDVLPTLWFRNTWSWDAEHDKPSLERVDLPGGGTAVRATHHRLGERWLHVPPGAALLFCENETNTERLWGTPNASAYVKDGVDRAVVHGESGAVNSERGTKVAVRFTAEVPARGEVSFVVLLDGEPPSADPLANAGSLLAQRESESDEFYASITPPALDTEQAKVLRAALAGMLWSKQHYFFDLDRWLQEHGGHPLRSPRKAGVRNAGWAHMYNDDVISMPDTWEYPWYAAWDLAFHTMALAMVDPDFAKSQLELMLSTAYLHPTGQIPAYEWNFSDVNPPVHAWAVALTYGLGRMMADEPGELAAGADDVAFLEDAFSRLLVNFTWWVNRKDPSGNNVFEGGFLGMDNVGVFDRSKPLPTGGRLEQADGTAWMAFFSQCMVELAVLLSDHEPAYEGFIVKFVQHFLQIAMAMDPIGEHPDEMWDEEDGFFYDVLRLPDGTGQRLEVRSMVGLLPLCATAVVPAHVVERFPKVAAELRHYAARNADLLAGIADPRIPGVDGRRLLALVDEHKLRRILERMLDEDRFLSPHGIRSVSKWHEENPYVFEAEGQRYEVRYDPAESRSGLFGGNSNWRGPVWMPVNVLLIRALLQFYLYYGDDLTVECPTGSGRQMTLYEVAEEISNRLVSTFTPDAEGRRPVFGHDDRFATDPLWREDLLFFEYFDGDTGAGHGASHQTGWTGVVARLAQMLESTDAQTLLHGPSRPFTVPYRRIADQPLDGR
jgi:hypothetical protein